MMNSQGNANTPALPAQPDFYKNIADLRLCQTQLSML
jgi:hypothetical protein